MKTDLDKVGIGDAVMTDSMGGLERIRFADGTSAIKNPDGSFRYCAVNGQGGMAPTVHQQAHEARIRGLTPRQFGDAYVDREANRIVAHGAMTDRLNNAWRG